MLLFGNATTVLSKVEQTLCFTFQIVYEIYWDDIS